MDEHCGQSAALPKTNNKKNTNLKQHPRTSELKKPMSEITKIQKKDLANTEVPAKV